MDKLSQTVSFVALSLVLILAGCGGGGGGSSATNTGNGTGGGTPTSGTTGGTQVVSPTTGTNIPTGTNITNITTNGGYYDFYYLQDAGGTPASTASTIVWSSPTSTSYNATYYLGIAGGSGGIGNTFTLGRPDLATGGFQADANVTIAQACPIVSLNVMSTNVLVEKTRTNTITTANELASQVFSALYDCYTQPFPSYNSLTVSAVGALTVSTVASTFTPSTPAVNIVVTSADFTSMLGGKWRLMNGVYYSFNAFSFVDTGGTLHYAIVMRGVPNLTGNTTGNAPNAFVSLWYK
jgi:hypothetical protein